MYRIDPRRLIQLRQSRGLSRRQLARISEVSERQLHRIETSDVHTTVHEKTGKNLAAGLDVSVSALSGEAPLTARDLRPGDFAQVDADCLRAARNSRKMTRAELAEVSGVSERHIARLESSRRDVQAPTLDALAGALDIAPDILTGRGRGWQQAEAVEQAEVRLAPELRLAYDLIHRVYGPTADQLVELAPLLFALLAEDSLAWRRERLAEAEAAMASMEGLAAQHHQLYYLRYLSRIEEGHAQESRSIESKDLLGDLVRDEDHWQWSGFNEDDLGAVTPFADFLCHLANKLGIAGLVDFWDGDLEALVGFDDIWGAEPYQVCRENLAELCGESKRARWALAHGDVRVADIPDGLLEPDATDARVRWLEDRLSPSTREHREAQEQRLRSLFAEIELKIQVPSDEEPRTSSRAEGPSLDTGLADKGHPAGEEGDR